MLSLTHYMRSALICISVLLSGTTLARDNSPPYVTATFSGQLGNQMFQVAAAYALALDNGARPLFPELATKKLYNIPINREFVFWRLDTTKPKTKVAYTFVEHSLRYAPITFRPNMCIQGFFQTEKYFKHRKAEILALFAPKEAVVDYLQSKYADILDHPNTVSIHLRTYFANDPSHIFYEFNGGEYLEKAVALFPEDALFVVFSDDIEWCQAHLSHLAANILFVHDEPHNDLYLMSMCKHNIISNSTFSWWGAYLNLNPEKVVVAPRKWFKPNKALDSSDFIPPEWVVID